MTLPSIAALIGNKDSLNTVVTKPLTYLDMMIDQDHYGQTRIQPMRLDTKGFLIDSFLCKQDKIFFFFFFMKKTFKYLARVLQSNSTQQALQNLILISTASSATV